MFPLTPFKIKVSKSLLNTKESVKSDTITVKNGYYLIMEQIDFVEELKIQQKKLQMAVKDNKIKDFIIRLNLKKGKI